MKKIILAVCVLAISLSSCKKEANIKPSSSTETNSNPLLKLSGRYNGPKTKKARAFGEPIFGKNTLPPEVSIVTTVVLDPAEFTADEYASISGARLYLYPEVGQTEEFSKIKDKEIALDLLSYDPKTGEMKFTSPLLEFKNLFPEKSYTAQGNLVLQYTNTIEKEKKNGTIVSKEKTTEEIYNLGDLSLITPRLGKPFLVEITRTSDAKLFSFLMYASSVKEIDLLFNDLVEFKKGMAKFSAKELKTIPAGLEEINPYYNVKNLHLVAIESDKTRIGAGSNPSIPWTYDPSFASFGIGTRSTASQANNKAELL